MRNIIEAWIQFIRNIPPLAYVPLIVISAGVGRTPQIIIISATTISTHLKRSRTPINNVVNFLKEGHLALDYYKRYKENKQRCGRKKIVLPKKEQAYIKAKIGLGWTTDVIVGRKEKTD